MPVERDWNDSFWSHRAFEYRQNVIYTPSSSKTSNPDVENKQPNGGADARFPPRNWKDLVERQFRRLYC
jgi:hypothetical protein